MAGGTPPPLELTLCGGDGIELRANGTRPASPAPTSHSLAKHTYNSRRCAFVSYLNTIILFPYYLCFPPALTRTCWHKKKDTFYLKWYLAVNVKPQTRPAGVSQSVFTTPLNQGRIIFRMPRHIYLLMQRISPKWTINFWYKLSCTTKSCSDNLLAGGYLITPGRFWRSLEVI